MKNDRLVNPRPSSTHHNLDELLVTQRSIAVCISRIDDGHHLVLGQFVSDVSHEMFELPRVNGPTAVLVQRPEGQPHHLLVIVSAHLCWREKNGKFDHFVDYIMIIPDIMLQNSGNSI